MTDRSIVLIDAGYLLAASAMLVTGSQYRRGIHVNQERLLKGLREFVQADSGLPSRRVVWYDAAAGGQPDEEHRRIGRLDSTKIRIGRIGVSGEQKGVDVRLVLDLIDIANAGRIETIYLVSGDDDLAEAVDRAQEKGVEVVLLGVPNPSGSGVMSAADNLLITVDRTVAIPLALLEDTIMPVTAHLPTAPAAPAATTVAPSVLAPAGFPTPRPGRMPSVPGGVRPAHPIFPASTPSPPATAPLDAYWVRERVDTVADRLAASISRTTPADELQRLLADRPSIPAEIDRVLLKDAASELGIDDLPDAVRHDLRTAFWQAVDEVS